MRRSAVSAVLAVLVAGCSGSGRPDGEVIGTGPVGIEEVQAAVFTPSCAIGGCHLGPGAPFGLDLSPGESFGNIVDVPSAEIAGFDRVDPFNPTDSYLFMKVTDDPRIQGDPMPAFGSPLSSRQLQILSDWIEQGANP